MQIQRYGSCWLSGGELIMIVGIIVTILLFLLISGCIIIGFADACGEATGEESIYSGDK